MSKETLDVAADNAVAVAAADRSLPHLFEVEDSEADLAVDQEVFHLKKIAVGRPICDKESTQSTSKILTWSVGKWRNLIHPSAAASSVLIGKSQCRYIVRCVCNPTNKDTSSYMHRKKWCFGAQSNLARFFLGVDSVYFFSW